MKEPLVFCIEDVPVTSGEIAVNNLESTLEQSWSRFWQDPKRPGIGECVVEQESLMAQFLGDLTALERLETLARHLSQTDGTSMRTALIEAQVASMAHRFAEARERIALATIRGATPDVTSRSVLGIDQACGTDWGRVLDMRRSNAEESDRLADWVALGALLADMRVFDEAERTYERALRAYQECSPFPLAWVCFQIGVMWGELASEPQRARAERWYQMAVDYLPRYVKARVHLAEIKIHDGRTSDAEALLTPVLSSGDPEVYWRLGDLMHVTGRSSEADELAQAARSGFECLLHKHPLAFADHGAEFYLGSGNDAQRAFVLASANLANRPTLRAFELGYAAAVSAGESNAASGMLDDARLRWGNTIAFRLSPLSGFQN